MKSLADPALVVEIEARIAQLTPNAQRRWGTMTAPEMLCHLADSYEGVLGERPLDHKSNAFLRTVGKFIALKLPLPWPKGLPTGKAVNPKLLGTKPGDFSADRARLLALQARFLATGGRMPVPHPGMGPMTPSEWLRWGYLHADHHLRQFGV